MDAATILEKALEKPAGPDRAEFLNGACGENADLKAEVLELIQAHDDAGDFLQPNDDRGLLATQVSEAPREQVGDRIGPYKLLQQIGEGGFGVVYMAEQTNPVKRKVALKVIKPGMDTKEVVARFEAERQALALMDHPNVAKVLDGGATANGRPYFVMELVKGIAITTYCDHNHLSTQQRLHLFISVCEAVQHAHHKGIIHRDLKPSNVLIAEYDDRSVPKIIDFGVAKALNQALTDKTLFTQFGQVIGTLEYMSPEQSRLNQLDIDTRSDIYSLGVLLYELLTGTTPFDRERFRSTRFDEVLRIIGEEEPPRPSTRLAMSDTLPAVAAGRATDAKHLPEIIRGDLDWIVMKALAKERSERYQSPNELADDVRRHLEFQPIKARRPSALGRVRRFAKRNRSLVSVGSVAAAAILLALAFGVFAVKQQQTWKKKEQDRVAVETKRKEEEAVARQIEAARSQFPRIRKLMEDGLVVAAYRMALDVRQVLPESDAALQTLWEEITSPITLETSPEYAKVQICDWDDAGRAWLQLGETTLENIRIPRGLVRWKFESPSHDTREFVRDFSNNDFRQVKLFQSPKEGMVVVPTSRAVKNAGYLAVNKAFLMDRHEVTNRQYKEFLDAGGYKNPKLWKHEFILNGEVISRDQAISKFVDQSKRPGPSTWIDGTYPSDQADFPVCGVSWYEAAAYAEFRGKKLPTIHHWYAASWASGTAKFVTPHSNFSGKRAPVGSHDGIGRLRIYDLAGNVAEWCYNEITDQPGARSLRGGASSDPDYMYIAPDISQAMDRSPRFGIRCVLHRPSEKLAAGIKTRTRSFDKPPASDEVMDVILSRYNHRPELKLNAKPVEVVLKTIVPFRHEAVQVDAAYGNERFMIHLFFPRDTRPPYETVVWVPGTGAFDATSFADGRRGTETRVQTQLLETGRAICLPECQGMYGRRLGNTSRVEKHIQVVQDIRRSIDYLETRPDEFQLDRLIYSGFSYGASHGAIVAAVENRFQAAVLINGGYQGRSDFSNRPEVDPYNFMSRVKIPVLMINGRYDAIFPVEAGQNPFLSHLGTPPEHKKLIHFKGGHGIPSDEAVQEMDKWLKAELGSQENSFQ